eukprot:jgi/Botrbrau1/9882/Bobra.0080s0017.1
MGRKKLGARTTAIEALQGADLSGKHAIVTGGNSGLGVETVRVLAHAGAHVVLTAKSKTDGLQTVQTLEADGMPRGKVEVGVLDLGNCGSIRAFAADVIKNLPRIDILVLNAGIMACPKMYTKDGFEMQFGVNYMGHFLLTQLLLENMKEQEKPSRIVVMSSEGHRLGKLHFDDLHYRNRHYNRWVAYGHSKLANILFAKELATRLADTPIKVFSLHPGIINTNLTRYTFLAPGTVGNLLYRIFAAPVLSSIARGTATTIYAAVNPDLEQHSGAYLLNCHVGKASADGRNADLARRLWETTEAQWKEVETREYAASLSRPVGA